MSCEHKFQEMVVHGYKYCVICGLEETLPDKHCNKCSELMLYDKQCGVFVCTECNNHEGLNCCFCGWRTHLLDPNENTAPLDAFWG